MADVFDSQKRSEIMARVRSSNNASTEQRLAKLLRFHHITGWRRNVRLPGSPDFVWRRERVAVFVDGCFWHQCPIHGETPRARLEYWSAKLKRNVERDRRVTKELRALGWTVLRIWECALSKKREIAAIRRIRAALRIRARSAGIS
jgi:DNA mismatch endonuclease (patch repair protein)